MTPQTTPAPIPDPDPDPRWLDEGVTFDGLPEKLREPARSDANHTLHYMVTVIEDLMSTVECFLAEHSPRCECEWCCFKGSFMHPADVRLVLEGVHWALDHARDDLWAYLLPEPDRRTAAAADGADEPAAVVANS